MASRIVSGIVAAVVLPMGFLLIVGLAGCGGQSGSAVDKSKPIAGQAPPPPPPPPPPDLDVPQKERQVTLDLGNGVTMKFVLIPAGEFTMGGPDSEEDSFANERPQHQVRITKPFYLGVYEVTQGQYVRLMGKNPSFFQDENNPVQCVSWEDAQEFCRRLSSRRTEKVAGCIYRLPTEAEWEYACRAGSTTKWCFGDSEDLLKEYAWHKKNSDFEIHPVGEMEPNAWGLHDMHGNVCEWCSDWYDKDYYKHSPAADPMGPKTGSRPDYYDKDYYKHRRTADPTDPKAGWSRVYRGGSRVSWSEYCGSAKRAYEEPSARANYIGFRVALVPPE